MKASLDPREGAAALALPICSFPNDLVDVVAMQDRLDCVGTHLQACFRLFS